MEHLAHRAPPERIDLEQFVREVLDGVVGDDPQPTTADEAIASVERALVAKARRPLNQSERVRMGIETAWQWNQRQDDHRLNPWVTSDGAFFRNDLDAKAHQKAVDEKAARHAARLRTRASDDLGAA